MIFVTLRDSDGAEIGGLVANEHAYKTGSRGYLAMGKVKYRGKRFQCSVSMVEIHSKPEAEDVEPSGDGTEKLVNSEGVTND